MQLTIDIPIHDKENNPISQAHLELYKEKFSHDSWEVLKRLVNGETLNTREATQNFLSGDLRARIRDLRNPQYGFGMPISDRWVKTDKSRYKEYFMTEADKIEALKILLTKMKEGCVMDKLVLDACCGSRMMWFDKNNQLTLFADIRTENHILCDGRALEIKPEIEMDFRDMPLESNSFHLVVFDPPHLKNLGQTSWMAKKYGVLSKTWQDDIKRGFDECMRVLKPNGVLIFKWNTQQIVLSKLLSVIEYNPLFGHTTNRAGNTIWMTFIKTV